MPTKYTRLTLPHEEVALKMAPEDFTRLITSVGEGAQFADPTFGILPSGYFACEDAHGDTIVLSAMHIVAIRAADEAFLQRWQEQGQRSGGTRT